MGSSAYVSEQAEEITEVMLAMPFVCHDEDLEMFSLEKRMGNSMREGVKLQ